MKIRVWDNFTRIYHMAQLVLIAVLWYSAEEALFDLHFSCAFILFGLWLTRLVWGFVGSESSRFSQFIKSPISVCKHLLKREQRPNHLGHNPIGGYMVLALLLSLGLQLVTGLFASDDVFSEGPLYPFFSESLVAQMDSLHHANFNVLLFLIGLHMSAGVLHLIKGDNVIWAIISGVKKDTAVNANKPLKFKSSWLALLLWGVLALMAYDFGMQYASY
ncbi:cytochrome b/b6 domain-containing protein [Thalassotalea aquiviva]|uniref:cytochrome b/b6 domain-containing protein n=1 Tax=Thalassotalea aquiviva TaxID=3242415 RepID=UPI00352A99EB